MPRILLVDDDPEFLEITKEFLLQEESTFEILTTPNPSEALEITRTTVREITKRKEVETALQQSEEKYRSLFEFSHDGIIIHDISGKIIDVNQKALALFGYSEEEMLMVKISDLHPPSSLDQSKKAFKAIVKEMSVRFEIDFKKKSGKLFSAEVSSSLFEIGGQKVVQGIIRDITEQRESAIYPRNLHR